MSAQPLVSIIIPTIGRRDEVDALLKSVVASSYQNIEVLVVDQNCDDTLNEIVARYKPMLKIRHLKVGSRGPSKARNYGVQFADGEIFCFPDDDCELLPDTLHCALEVLEETGAAAIFGRAFDRQGADAVTQFHSESGYLSLAQHEKMFVEFSIFVRRDVHAQFPYDENLGVGTFHGAEEGHDQVLRMLKGGLKLFYSTKVRFYHPIKVTTHSSPREIRRVFTYRCGFSRLCVKHKLWRKLLSRMIKVALYLPYACLFKRQKARYYAAELLGLWTGLVVP